jgi:polysaccharide pyruvyl transferase WcaK-like protein
MSYTSYIIYILIGILVIFFVCLIIYAYNIFKCDPANISQNSLENFETRTERTERTEGAVDSEYCDYGSANCSNNLIIQPRNRVLVVSCYGYGNIGDNMYGELFTKYLPECEVIKISDHSIFVDSHKKFIRTPPQDDYPFDFLIIGGGGLLTANKLKKSLNMPYYIGLAKRKNKPLFIVSCGVQGSITNFKQDFQNWKEPFDYATLITVRSKKDKELLSSIVKPDKIHYFRDLGYIFPHTLRPYKTISKTITLIIAGPVDDKNKHIRKIIDQTKKDVVIMNMGSLKDDNNNKRMIKMNFPGVSIVKFYGCGVAPEFSEYDSYMVDQDGMEEILKENPNINGINPGDLTLQKVINTIYNSDIVYTGRYHGMIFSRSLGVKYDTLGMDTNKVVWEEPVTNIKDMVANSYNHIKMLRKHMNLYDTSAMDMFNLQNSIDALTA